VIVLLVGVALAGDLIEKPAIPDPVEGECGRVYPIRKGQQIPEMVARTAGEASCSAVAVPLSQYADMLAIEQWSETVAQQYRVDVAALEMERDWYKSRLEEETKPLPWLLRPETQRWFGRLETLATVGVVAAGLGAAYSYGSGATK